MISRASAKTIADAYHECFTVSRWDGRQSKFEYLRDSLYDFLYVNDFAGLILNALKDIASYSMRGLLEFIMRLHTGESLGAVTPEWTWNQRERLGQRFLHDLAESLIKARHSNPDFGRYNPNQKGTVDLMQRQLELDGYIFRDGVLLVPEESVLDEGEEQGALDALITRLRLPDPETVRHHLRLSEDHYRAERWDDSISNSRKVLEAILQQVAALHSETLGGGALTAEVRERPVRIRDYLETAGLLDKKEKEAIAATYSLLSDTGVHPHIGQRDQARLMRHLALTFSQFVLLRLQGALSS